MKYFLPSLICVALLCGCASQPQPPPKPDPLERVLTGLVALSQVSQANKQVSGIRADTTTLFPSRSQAVALGLVSYRLEIGRWPTTKEELEAFFVSNYKMDAPPSGELSDLTLRAFDDERLEFALKREGLPDERYTITKSAVISFPIRPARPEPVTTSNTQPRTSEFPWGDFAARLFIELPLRLALKK